MVNTQLEALRLAGVLDNYGYKDTDDAAAELRRLYEVNQELLEALKDVMYWENGKPEWDVARAAIAKATEEQA